MADQNSVEPGVELNRTRVILALLFVGGCFVAGGAVVWGLAGFWRLSQSADPTFGEFVNTLALMLAGLAGAALLWGIEEVIRRLDGVQAAVERPSADSAPVRAPVRARSEMEATPKLDELVVLMREVRDISLLSDAQRSMRLEAQGRAVVNVLEREVPVLLREHNWIEARRRVQQARERFPTFPQWDALEKQIETMRRQVEDHDVEAAERQINDLSMLGAWDRVAEVVEELMERHPESARAHAISQKLRVQRNSAEAEQRAALMRQAQEATNRRDWVTALEAATTLVNHYPRSPEAQVLRLQLPTLRENAEIKERQALEGQFLDMFRQRRYDEALELAEQVLNDYPNSPQARMLREQLPKLREMAVR